MKSTCDSCGWSGTPAITAFHDIPDLEERLDAGGIVPSGVCPKCEALCYPSTGLYVSAFELQRALQRLLNWTHSDETKRALNCTGVLGDFAGAALEAQSALDLANGVAQASQPAGEPGIPARCSASPITDLRPPSSALSAYTVLLCYPDYMQDGGDTNQTYMTTVEAADPKQAIERAQWCAKNDNVPNVEHHTDFAALCVIAGDHQDIK